jgi:DNA polymerase elongation subunit (family B)
MMSKFYTNIEHRGDNILYMGWENGMPVKQKIKYKPHLFIQSKDNQKTDYTSFSTKKYLSRVDFDSIHDMKEYVKTYSDISNFEIYGCSDIIRQFTRSMFGSGEISWDYTGTKIWFFDIETRVEGMTIDPSGSYQIRIGDEIFTRGYPDIMQMLEDSLRFDFFEDGKFVPVKESKDYRAGFPKPEKAEQEVLLISMVDHHKEKLYVWSVKPVSKDNKIFELGADFRSFETEKAMLKDFLLFWKSTRIDIISGWNSEIFDIPYLINRMKRVLGDDLTNHMSPWNVVKERRYVENDSEYQTYDIYGITHLDYLIIYKKFNPGSKESFKLDYIAEYELGEKKVENPTDNFRDFYLEHWEIFTFYNSIDVMLLHKMEHKKLLVRLAMQLAYIAKCNFGDVVSAMRLWESIIYNYFMDEWIIEDYTKKSNKKEQIVGAYVHEPKPGKSGWTVSIDALSKYPSIMMQNNISPEMIVGFDPRFNMDSVLNGEHIGQVEEGTILSCNGLITKKGEMGFIPILVKRMFDLRKQTKNKMLELKKEQQKIKETLESLGVAV